MDEQSAGWQAHNRRATDPREGKNQSPAPKFAAGDVVRLIGQTKKMIVEGIASATATELARAQCVWHDETGRPWECYYLLSVLEDAREKTAAAEPTKGPWTIKDNSQYFVLREKDGSLTNQDGTPYVWPRQAAYDSLLHALGYGKPNNSAILLNDCADEIVRKTDNAGTIAVLRGTASFINDALALVRKAEKGEWK